jgi:polyhydroxybutyrate depolymerase
MARTEAKGSLTPNDEPVLLGAETDGDRVVRPFSGRLEEAALWTRALGDDEVSLVIRGEPLTAKPMAGRLGPGDHERTLTVDDRQRSYLVHVPPGYDADTPTPLVLVFHGAGMNARLMAQFCELHKKSDQSGFVAVYPNGTGAANLFLAFNTGAQPGAKGRPDDVRFVAALLDDLAHAVNVDSRRVYATGISNGAMMCYRLAAELSDRIAAIAPVAGAATSKEIRAGRPVPIVHFHGSADAFVPPSGPGEKTPRSLSFLSLDDSLEAWARHNGCPNEPIVTELPDVVDDGTRVTRKVFGPGTDGAEVVLYLVAGGGHTWPGQKSPLALVGKSTADISANDLMWEFFQKHPLQKSP